jgi:hypothetical protein
VRRKRPAMSRVLGSACGAVALCLLGCQLGPRPSPQAIPAPSPESTTEETPPAAERAALRTGNAAQAGAPPSQQQPSTEEEAADLAVTASLRLARKEMNVRPEAPDGGVRSDAGSSKVQ